MAIIDAQVHAYERDHPGRPWVAVLPGPAEVTGDDLVAAMDAVGVDGALLTSAWTMYRYDASYAVSVQAAHPGRFGLIKPVDPSDPTVAETIADWAAMEAGVAVRIMLVPGVAKDADAAADPDDPAVSLVLEEAARHSLPVNLLCWGRLEVAAKLAANHPRTSLIIDHMGFHQPFVPPAPAEPFADLPLLLDLAPYENVTVKITGACTLSHQPFPYPDIWDPLARIFDTFGFDRCVWGTDWTRAVNLLTYEQGVEAFRLNDRLSDGERADLMGGTLARIYGWSPTTK
ncbi:MAG TPA: amidohydrolase family protein [Alphaproteobacteria bacterium]|jgi:predicted TIM-barrel fold metal-dependent hydrolase|nr:amidohydrolase family protein [Alphaproteobacteria bacterium]